MPRAADIYIAVRRNIEFTCYRGSGIFREYPHSWWKVSVRQWAWRPPFLKEEREGVLTLQNEQEDAAPYGVDVLFHHAEMIVC